MVIPIAHTVDPRLDDRQADDALAIRAQADPRAFEELYERHFPRVLRFLALRTPSREVAEDLAAQTFLNALEHIRSYRAGSNVTAWIFRIARNLLIDTYRVSGRTTRLDEDLPLPYDAGIRDRTERVLQQEALAACMDRLSPVERDVLTLRVGSELSHAEIAATLGKTETAVKVAYSRAVRRLRELLSSPSAD